MRDSHTKYERSWKLIVVLLLLAMTLPTITLASESPAHAAIDTTTIDARCKAILIEGLSCEEFWPSMHAAEGLTEMGHGERVRSHLEPMLAEITNPQHRVGLARELVRAGDTDKVTLIVNELKDPESNARVHAAETLFKLGLVGDIQAMREATTQPTDARLRVFACAALARHAQDKPEAQPELRVLRELLNHHDPAPRRHVTFVLGTLQDKESETWLLNRLAQPDLEESEYQSCLSALAQLGNQQGLDSLANLLTSESKSARAHAAMVVGDIGYHILRPELIALLDDPETDVRIRAAHALYKLDHSK